MTFQKYPHCKSAKSLLWSHTLFKLSSSNPSSNSRRQLKHKWVTSSILPDTRSLVSPNYRQTNSVKTKMVWISCLVGCLLCQVQISIPSFNFPTTWHTPSLSEPSPGVRGPSCARCAPDNVDSTTFLLAYG